MIVTVRGTVHVTVHVTVHEAVHIYKYMQLYCTTVLYKLVYSKLHAATCCSIYMQLCRACDRAGHLLLLNVAGLPVCGFSKSDLSFLSERVKFTGTMSHVIGGCWYFLGFPLCNNVKCLVPTGLDV